MRGTMEKLTVVGMTPESFQTAKYRSSPDLRASDQWDTREALLYALQHWYELDPADARKAILEEIVRAQPLYSAKEIGVLLDRALPDQETELLSYSHRSRRTRDL